MEGEIHSIEDLIDSISHGTSETFETILETSEIPISCFEALASYSSEAYKRITLFENQRFELKLLCWEPGQQTPIHDHGGEECWVKFLKGDFIETIYDVSPGESAQNMKQTKPEEGQITYMIDSLGFHCLKNEGDQRGMTLHLYAKPVRSCLIYNRETEQILNRNYQ